MAWADNRRQCHVIAQIELDRDTGFLSLEGGIVAHSSAVNLSGCKAQFDNLLPPAPLFGSGVLVTITHTLQTSPQPA